jgi:hypothetical protein
VKKANARLPVRARNAGWLRASSRITGPTFGVKCGLHWHPSMFGPLGHASLASTSSRSALCRLTHYADLVLEKAR